MKNICLCLLAVAGVVFFSCCSKKKEYNTNGSNTIIKTPTPLIDFGTGFYRGFSGGLYPGGTNIRPAAHNTAGIAIAQAIKPLDYLGTLNETNGKIVWMSVGMSNTTQETSAFLSLVKTYTNKNPKLTLIDGAEGGQDINSVNNPNAAYWDTINNRLTAAGLSTAQVQIIWFKEAEAAPSDTAFATYPDALKSKYRSVMLLLKSKFPNLKLCYVSDRIYAGYATTNLNPEPFAWYTGWTVKRLIADQINGDATLRYSGANPAAAWLSWGPYLWANGTTPRSDGLTWAKSDYQPDGTHPGNSGRQKVAQMLLDFFSTDETAKPWFLKP